MALDAKKIYGAATTYTDEALKEVGSLRGKPCTIKKTEHKDGRTKIVFEWTANDGTTRETTIYVYDGTPIYVWESGNTYKYGDLVIYESAFYRCIVENSATDFNDNFYEEINSTDGNYDIVQNRSLLPTRFTPADKKMFYAYEEERFYFWNGTAWQPQKNVTQYDTMPVARELLKGRIVQFTGTSTDTLKKGYFYECVQNEDTLLYSWQPIDTQEVKPLTAEQLQTLIDLI